MVVRLLLIPVIAGVSYEFIRLAGTSENKIVGLLSKPGLAMQHLTTKEPTDDSMIEVAIAAVETVSMTGRNLYVRISVRNFRDGRAES